MIRISILLLFVFFLFSCTTSSKKELSESFLKTIPGDYMFMQRAYPTGQINMDAYTDAIQWKNQLPQNRNQIPTWQFEGPVNVGGRITDIEIPSSQSQTYYVGAASGGVFKSTDAGGFWLPIFDDQAMLSIGDIETSDSNNNLVWVGTGEPNGGGGSLTYNGDGIYKSTNGGNTWENKGLPNVGSISKIVISPTDDNTILFGAMGPIFKNDSNRGVYKTTNGGDTWEQVLFVSDSTGISDMAIHPTNGNIIYATSWERIRRPSYRQYGGETSNIYRTMDGGSTWNILTNGLPSAPSQKGRITIDISKSNPNVLYAQYSDASGALQGAYKTTNGGDSWTAINSGALTNVGFNYWFGGIFIDPTNENIVYYIGFLPQKSIDGGATWSDSFPNVHVDQHGFAFNESNPGEILLGNDGGLYKSINNGASAIKDNSLPITQFYRYYVDAQNVNKRYGGAQDNNTIRTQTGGLNDWDAIFGGDGFQPLADPNNTNAIYALSQYGNLGKSTNNGASFSGAMNGISGSDPKNWDTPITFDPNNSQILYYGANKVYKTTNAAASWTSISPDLSNGPYNGNLTFGTIISIDVSPLDSTLIYVGTDDGNVWETHNGGNNWNLVSSTLPNRWVTKVLASRNLLNTVYVTFSGYRYGENTGHVYKSVDAGINWTDISTNLPDIPINDIVQDSFGNLFIATDIGVIATKDEGITWEMLDDNFPSVVVTDLFIHEGSQRLFAATYGRSSYSLDISDNVLGITSFSETFDIKIYPNPASEYVIVQLGDTSKGTINIYDISGKSVFQNIFDQNESNIQLSLEGITSGIYFLKIEQGNREITKKLIVK